MLQGKQRSGGTRFAGGLSRLALLLRLFSGFEVPFS